MKPSSLRLYFSLFLFLFSQVTLVFSQKPQEEAHLNEKLSQFYVIKGTILNQHNESIIQADVIVVGKATGTITNVEGQFILLVPALPVTLRVTSPGCKSLDTTISVDHIKLILHLNCDVPNPSTLTQAEKEFERDFRSGKMELPILIRENIQLGRFNNFDSLPKTVKYN